MRAVAISILLTPALLTACGDDSGRGGPADAGRETDAGPIVEDGSTPPSDAGNPADATAPDARPSADAIDVITFGIDHVTERGFEARAAIVGDADGDATATVALCSETMDPGCVPAAGSTYEMDRLDDGSFERIVWNLSAAFAEGDQVNVAVEVTDPDGVLGEARHEETLFLNERRQFLQGAWRVGCRAVPGTSYFGRGVISFNGHRCRFDESQYSSGSRCSDGGWGTEAEVHYDCTYHERTAGDGIYLLDVYRTGSTPSETWTVQLASGVTFDGRYSGLGGVGIDRPGMPLYQPRATVSSSTGFDAALSFNATRADIATTSATVFYCNQTDDPGCDPRAGAGVPLTAGTPQFTATVDDPALSLDTGDELYLLFDVSHTPDVYEPSTLRHVHTVP